MKSIKYFPFERNRYFYGKLLSVDDFETEQKYMNNKRCLINRFIHGTGVVCGLSVTPVNDGSISVEKGIAFDNFGREIVVDSPVIKKLSMIDGFDNYNDQDLNNSHLYLCIEYHEEEKEPVHSITNSKTKGIDGVEYNKYMEGFHLYLTNQEPETEDFTVNYYYEDTKTIYWGNRIRIKQIVPKYVESNAPFEIKIIVENMGQQRPFSFSYDLDLTCIQPGGKGGARISFDESQFEKASRYEFTYPLKAIAVKDIDGKVTVADGSFSLNIGGKKTKAEAKGSSLVHISENGVVNEIIKNYYNSAMEEITRNNYQQGIYLAKIAVIKAGNTYVIDEVEAMPFQQYVFSNTLSSIINNLSLGEMEGKQGGTKHGDNAGKKALVEKNSQEAGRVAVGTAILDLGIGGVAGQKFFSQEIVHGLGLGPINITLGKAEGLGDEGNIIYGAQDIFDDGVDVVKAELAAKVDVLKGSFIIGLKCLEPTNVRQVKIHWMAVKDSNEIIYEREQKTMNIKPDILNLSICETYYFEALISGETVSRVKWSVKEEGGGTIDDNGMYTAPNKVGVFEIIAESLDYPDQKASTFVVVRDL